MIWFVPRPRIKPAELESREGVYLRIARRIFAREGFDGLTMEKIAAQTSYSKGTIYQHFASKEDVLAALCLDSGRRRLELVERAAGFRGTTRERAIAIAKADYLVFRLHRDYWRTEQLHHLLRLSSRVSPARRTSLRQLTERGAAIAMSVVHDGIAQRELELPKGLTPEKVFLGLLGTTRGLYLYCSGNPPFSRWVGNLWQTHEQLLGCACDGFGWRPFSKDWNYAATLQRIRHEIFPKEAARLRVEFQPHASVATTTHRSKPTP